MPSVEVCLSPLLFDLFKNKNATVIVIDILRATSSICSAFYSGVQKIIPVGSLDEALIYKQKGYLIAAEREGVIVDFADYGNSPVFFSKTKLQNKTLVFSSTNGTPAIQLASSYSKVLIGSFLNINAITDYIIKENNNVILLCSGWKDNISLEDTLFAGAVAKQLIDSGNFISTKDATRFAVESYLNGKNNLIDYTKDAEHVKRLIKLNAYNDVEFCLSPNNYNCIPTFLNGKIIDAIQ